MTTFQWYEFVASCTFNQTDECLKEERFTRHHDHLDCFTFNAKGRDKLSSPAFGLELVLYKKPTEFSGLISGTDSFKVIIHEPGVPPLIENDALQVDVGRSTTIRIKRQKTVYEQVNDTYCNPDSSRSKELCEQECVLEKCVASHQGCSPFTNFRKNGSEEKSNFTSSDLNFCYLAAFLANGLDGMDMAILRVILAHQ